VGSIKPLMANSFECCARLWLCGGCRPPLRVSVYPRSGIVLVVYRTDALTVDDDNDDATHRCPRWIQWGRRSSPHIAGAVAVERHQTDGCARYVWSCYMAQVGVVGLGLMGHGIAQTAAEKGFQVRYCQRRCTRASLRCVGVGGDVEARRRGVVACRWLRWTTTRRQWIVAWA
jgi:hypothetical protein